MVEGAREARRRGGVERRETDERSRKASRAGIDETDRGVAGGEKRPPAPPGEKLKKSLRIGVHRADERRGRRTGTSVK
jgi:hypothetical protein